MKSLFIFVFLFSLTAHSQTFDFSAKSSHIVFSDDIPATRYSLKKHYMTAEVKKSASALVYAFAQIAPVKEVSFSWKTEGDTKVTSASQEKTKAGDDFKLRIGLILSGEAPFVPFFAPAWVKAIRDALILPTDKMIYLAVGTRNPVGSVWESPYSDSMTNIVLPSKPLKKGWQRATYKADKPLKVVGLWIMADGDNTQASFKTYIRYLKIK